MTKTFIGKIDKTYIDDEVREVTIETYDKYPIDSRQILPPGIDANPIKEDQGVAITIDSSSGKTVCIGIMPTPEVEPGEIKIFSRIADGTKKAILYLKKDGIMEVNGDADFAVRFSVLETEFNKLRDAWDTFANAYVAGGPAVQGFPSAATASAADLSGAKVDEVKLP